MLLTILLGGVWPTVCAATCTVCACLVSRDQRRRDDAVDLADDYAHEAWGYLCEIRDIREQVSEALVNDTEPDTPTEVIVPRSMRFTPAQADRARGAAGRHRRDNP